MLSFTHGSPIARVVGGKDKGKILRVDMDTAEATVDIDDIFDILTSDVMTGKTRKRYNPSDLETIRECVKRRKEPRRDDLRDIFNRVIDIVDEARGKEYHIHDGTLTQVPNTNLERESLYIAGPSGSGKSTYLNNYVKEYKRVFPRRGVYIFSRVQDDKTLEDNDDINQVIIDEELLEDPIEKEDLRRSAVIFDDVDTIQEKPLIDYVTHLRSDILETGRHDKITLLCTSHLLMDYKKTRTLLNEASSVTFFPRSGSTYHIQRFLKIYCGLNNRQIDRILNLPSRWVTINKTAPMWVLYSQGCYLL
jgi:hypothetical protein